MQEIYQEIINLQNEGKEASIATVVSAKGSTPRNAGAKMLIRSDGTTVGSIGGGAVEAEVCKEAMNVIKEGKTKLLHFDLSGKGTIDMVCGGNMDVFIEPISAKPELYIFGGGHVSVALSKISELTGFKAIVIDEKAVFVESSNSSSSKTTYALNEKFKQQFEKLSQSPSAYIAIVTGSYQLDEKILELALKTRAKYIGMLASKKKREVIFTRLMESGVSRESLARVHSPIGLEIYAETPEEIAISILAEIIKVRKSEG